MAYAPPSSAKPFTLNVPDKDFSEWKQLLELSKIAPETWEGSHEDGRYGVSRRWLIDAKDYWLNQYDWRAQEKHINSFPNYKIKIEDIDVHFIALFSEKKDAIPIIFMHGWPGSFIEFLPMLGLIRDKYAAKDLPYHIIVPSLPGFTLSSGGPLDRDWTPTDSARIMDKMMRELGFSKYLAQGGDVGSIVGTILVTAYDSCVGVHLNLITVPLPDGLELSTIEKESLDRATKWRATGMAYALEHSSRPSTISLVLSSNPLALLAWIGEKFVEWTDTTPSLDHILTNISLYWFTSGFPRSIYPYRVIFAPDRKPTPFISKPLGFSFFPHELFPGIKGAIEKNGNLVFYKQHEKGGHFAALEQPNELLADVEEYVKVAWKV
ncbi:epoxide hydrolase-like protein [Melanomma pulvis-pyrius CBS 109.77]|uniref:Epoxide hydrolase-like protein n=1 Tax=Melanomma pulvis-pyrius CBS 109.77 TaxID=1314802 RepID=A0A6A6WZU5_9PLEO|nr:epoxide hydrolase-like protein [Melanomma pulvis-pyrius CBS 109.77]